VFLKMRRNERGVSLAEVLVAMFILSVVGVATIVGVGTSVKVNELARARISAESLARSELEFVSSHLPIDGELEYILQTGSQTYIKQPASWNDVILNTMPEGYTGYSITVKTIPNLTETVGTYIKQKITADVKYKGGDVLQIETYLAQY
jgi:type II secretory pathway pseudopilin PulG